MADLSHWHGGDLAIGATGDLRLTEGGELVRQRVLRRLLTNPGDDAWTPDYGAGLPRAIGLPANAAQLSAPVRAQLALEVLVAADPPPSVRVEAGENGTVFLRVEYADAAGLAPSGLVVDVGGGDGVAVAE